jgi:hypothetical protein
VAGEDAPLTASIQDGVNRNDVAGRENAHLVGGVVHGAPARTVRHIGHLVEPLPQLLIEIVEIAEAAAQEEVLRM